MNRNKQNTGGFIFPKLISNYNKAHCRLARFLLVMGLLFSAVGASAVQLVWDPGNTNSPSPIIAGSGNWDTSTTNLVWNSNGVANVSWTQLNSTTGTNGAIFGGANNNNYTVTMDAGNVFFTNLQINSSGYTFISNGIDLSAASEWVTVSNDCTVNFDCNIPGQNNAKYWLASSNSQVNINGNMSGDQLYFLSSTNASFNLNGTNTDSAAYINGIVNYTNGLFHASSYSIGYAQTLNGVSYKIGVLTISGTASYLMSANSVAVGRSGGQGTIIVNTSGSFTMSDNTKTLFMCNDGNATESGTFDVYSGTVDIGTSPSVVCTLQLDDDGSVPGEAAVFCQTGGVVNAWGGIELGSADGTYSGGTDSITNTGGSLYLGPLGIYQGAASLPVSDININLSGGTLGALASWSSSLPMTLSSANGNTTFQCADNFADPYNITLSGALTGSGGLNQTGGGTLTLSGADNYSGGTTVSNGELLVESSTTPFTMGGPLTLDSSAGIPSVSFDVKNQGEYFSIGGLTFSSGTPLVDFQFGSIAPSTSVAPLQIDGNVNLTVTPTLQITNGSSISVGTYPLIQYTGVLSGTPPTSISLPSYCSGYIANITGTKTIALVITSSTYNPPLSWKAGNGVWDINTTADWNQAGNAVTYADGDSVLFDDTATGPSPITVTLNTVVNPGSMIANNITNSYIIAGSGSIAGSTSMQLLNRGVLTLAGTNSYSGGTIISGGGQLNINNGGSVNATAIGTGMLTLDAGAVIDDTGTSNVTLQASVPEAWNGGFTYVGSTNGFNTGNGSITINANISLTVNNNDYTVGGPISDNGNNYSLTKLGNGALTLPIANNFGGGLALAGGTLNIGDPNCLGSGICTISGGATIDNISGAPIVMNTTAYTWAGVGFTFLGSADLDLGAGTCSGLGGGVFTVDIVSNTFTTEGDITTGNTLVTKTGQGMWAISGFYDNGNNVQVVVDQGVLELNKTLGNAIGKGASGLTVQSNAMAICEQSSQMDTDPVTLNAGGVLDLNGTINNVGAVSDNNGVLQDSNSGNTSVLGTTLGNVLVLTGTNCMFNVPVLGESMDINTVIAGGGSMVLDGAGELALSDTNTYTGDTTINSGILALTGSGSISNTVAINIGSDATLDVSARGDDTLTLNTGQTLMGNGSINGNLVSLPGATVSPGAPVGLLNVANNVTLEGNLLINLNSTNSLTSSKLASIAGTVTFGGILTVTNVGPVLTVGTTFQIFPSAVTAFGEINLATTDASGYVYTWNNNIAANGSIQVASVANPINPLSGTIQVAVSADTLSLSWPTNLGWILQSETNLPGTNWVDVPGSAGVTSTNITINPSIGSCFYRLVHP